MPEVAPVWLVDHYTPYVSAPAAPPETGVNVDLIFDELLRVVDSCREQGVQSSSQTAAETVTSGGDGGNGCASSGSNCTMTVGQNRGGRMPGPVVVEGREFETRTEAIVAILREQEDLPRWRQSTRQDIARMVGCTVGRVGEVVRAGGANYSREVERTQRGNRAQRRADVPVGARRFGLEIEFHGNANLVAEAMRAEGLQCSRESYNHHTRGYWKIVPDGSVHNGAELVSPPLQGEEGRRQVEAACRALRAAGATVSNATGLHVHHEVTDLSVRAFSRVFSFWNRAQRSIDCFVPASRRDNQYATRLSSGEVAAIEQLANSATPSRRMTRAVVRNNLRFISRYRTINVQSFPRYGTIEIRQHQGTLNAKKIMEWVAFGQSVFAWAKSRAEVPAESIRVNATLQTLAAHGGLSQDTVRYYTSRARTFARTSRNVDMWLNSELAFAA